MRVRAPCRVKDEEEDRPTISVILCPSMDYVVASFPLPLLQERERKIKERGISLFELSSSDLAIVFNNDQNGNKRMYTCVYVVLHVVVWMNVCRTRTNETTTTR